MVSPPAGKASENGLTRRRFLQLSGIAGAAAVSGGLVGCDAGIPGRGRKGDVRIVFLSTDGDANAVRTATSLKCLNLAVDEVNAAGGIAGRHVTVVQETARADARASADKVAQLMRREPFDVLIAPLSDQQRRALTPQLPKLNALVLDPSPRDDQGCSRYLVSTGQVPSQQVEPLALWVLQNAGRRIYAVRSEDSWSRAAATTLQNRLSETKAMPVGSVVVRGAPEMRSVIRDIRQANPDVLWCLLPQPDAERFAQALSETDVHALVVMNAWDELSATAHPGLIAGAITSQPWFMSLTTPESKAFTQRYEARYGAHTPVNALGEATYDALHMYRSAVDRARTTSVAQVSDALTEVEINTPQGPVRVDRATRVMTTHCIIGVNSGRGTIETHGDLGMVAPRLSGCTNPAR